jgi:Bifunctional DNA primase/polymerase, N-terminal
MNFHSKVNGNVQLPWSTPTLTEFPAKLYHALELAREYRIFPVMADAKKPPLISNWPIAATRNEDQIRQWWEQWPDANIARPRMES